MATAESTTVAPADLPRSRIGHLRSAFSMSGAMLTAVIALCSGGIALFFQLRPDLQPDPRTKVGADAEVFAVDGEITLKTYLARRAALVSPAELRAERALYLSQAGGSAAAERALLTLPGEDVYVRLNVEGFKSRSIGLLASMYDAKTRRRLRELDDVPVFSERLSSPSDRSVVEFWLPAPPVTTRRYFVRVAVYHRGDGVLLAIADSPAIAAS